MLTITENVVEWVQFQFSHKIKYTNNNFSFSNNRGLSNVQLYNRGARLVYTKYTVIIYYFIA